MTDIDPRKPTIRNQASIINCTLEVRVYWKDQLKPAIDWLIENDYEYSWNIQRGDSVTLDVYALQINTIHWANNLTQFAKVLKKCDYKFD